MQAMGRTLFSQSLYFDICIAINIKKTASLSIFLALYRDIIEVIVFRDSEAQHGAKDEKGEVCMNVLLIKISQDLATVYQHTTYLKMGTSVLQK
jgi:hypothetical protein